MHEAQLRQMLENEQAEPDISAKQFLLKTLLWLPVCFIGWYLLAALFSFPAIRLSDLLLPLIMPGVMEGVEQQGYMVDIITQLNIQASNGQIGQFAFGMNALKYGYGFPLILAMMLATPYSFYNKLDDMTYGLIVVVLAQTWGIMFEALSSLMLKTGTDITNQVTNILPWTQSDFFLNFVALGYQLGFLILPAVVPIAFWIMRHKGLLERLARQ
ncbi:MAG: exosortase H-associated membrane protein [Thiolinea sp.]